LIKYLDVHFDFVGARLFQYLSFRAAAAVLLSLTISMVFGKRLINWLRYKQVGETIRDLGLDGQMQKTGTPTMGGIIILMSILIPTLLFADLTNVYIQTLLIATVWLGMIGFLDDYIKVFKKDKEGLAGKFKIIGQIGAGVIVASMLYWNPTVTIKERTGHEATTSDMVEQTGQSSTMANWEETKNIKTTIPFIKDNEFDYSWLLPQSMRTPMAMWIVFTVVVIIIVTAVSNGANITDGIDGLAAGSSAIIGVTLAILAYVSGNYIFADYLNIMYIPRSGELTIFIAAFVGSCIGFLWYNSYPAQVFMGDTGSLALGGIIAVFSIAIRKELLIPVLCGIFLIENLSVIIQVSYFKYTKKKYGEGRRVFLMSPLHHHFQKKGMHEAKIVSRFWIVGILLAVVTIITLKTR
jgi:phospho-N-acetylmuramoyl-pentapeptide-transferase